MILPREKGSEGKDSCAAQGELFDLLEHMGTWRCEWPADLHVKYLIICFNMIY